MGVGLVAIVVSASWFRLRTSMLSDVSYRTAYLIRGVRFRIPV